MTEAPLPANEAARAAGVAVLLNKPIVPREMTANALPGDRERCLAAGMDEYISKPVRPEELRAVIGRFIGARLSAPPAPGAAQPSVEAEAPVDILVLDGLRELQEPGGQDVVAEFIDLFLGDLPGRLATIREGIAEQDAEQARGAAHALKSSSAYLGAMTLSKQCKELEHAARQRDLPKVSELCEVLEREANRAEEFLRQHRSTLDAEVGR